MDMHRLKSLLYLPANRESAIARARTLPAHAVILDLEDAVQPEAKAAARDAAAAAIAAGGWGGRALFVRVNGIGTPWHDDDMVMLRASTGLAGVVVPKIDSAAQAASVVAAAAGLPLVAMIETPAAVLAAAQIAAVPGVAALLAGMADLAKALQCGEDAMRTPLLYSLSAIVLAARSAGIACFDGVVTDVRNETALRAEAAQARLLGFDGKSLIHPAQVEPCNAVFAPTADEIAQAQGLIAAYEAALAAGRGVATYNGRLVEVLHVEQARRLLGMASAQ